MKKWKTLFAFVTAFSMSSLYLPFIEQVPPETNLFSAHAETIVTGSCGENLTYSYVDSTGTLTISGTGAMNDYDLDSKPVILPDWYTQDNIRIKLKKVVIESGVTSIGNLAFYQCTALEEVILPDTLTTIGMRAFFTCERLNKINIPDSVTQISARAFTNCKNLTEINIPEGITSIEDGTFYGCNSLTSVILPNSITSLGEASFYSCSNLTEIVLPEGLKTIGKHAFFDNHRMEEVTLPASVTSIADTAFSSCNGLKKITILNPDCEFKYFKGVFSNATIYGYDYSTAWRLADKFNLEFVSLGAIPEKYTPQAGDITGDGSIGVSDVILLQKYLLAQESLTKEQFEAADLTQEGIVNVFDLVLLKKKLLGLI